MTQEPYRLYFPLGWLLAVLGLGRMVSAGVANPGPKGLLFHSVVMVEGFVAAFAFGFLFTFIPRRTRTAVPAPWQLALPALALVGAAVAALLEREALGHAIWLAGAAVVIAFALRRLAAAGALRRVPPAFVWVPVSLLGGATGAALILASRVVPPTDGPRLWALGRGLLLQGLIPGLAIGVGALLVPQLTRGEPPPPEFSGRGARVRWAVHGLLALLFVASFPLEVLSSAGIDRGAGLALRGTVALAALLIAARIDRPPTAAGTHRRLLWLSAWLLPLGWLVAALLPKLRGPALHVGFVGGFALMTLAVSLHVVRSHGGQPEPLGRPWRGARWMGGLGLAALGVRFGVGLLPDHGPALLGLAASLLLAAFVVWIALAWRALRPAPGP